MIGVIGGSGLYHLDGLLELGSSHCETAYGEPSSDLVRVRLEDNRTDNPSQESYFLARHGTDHSIPPHRVNYRANIQALYDSKVKQIVAVNAVGSCDPSLAEGTIVLPEQLIDYTTDREHTFFDQLNDFGDHIDFTEPFSGVLQGKLQDAAAVVKVPVHLGGTYGVTQGPRLETAAEVQRLIRDGCDLVGMTAMPEAALARERGIEYASLCVVVNMAAGLNAEAISTAAISVVLEQAMGRVGQIIKSLLELESEV